MPTPAPSIASELTTDPMWGWLTAALWVFGPTICTLVGWLISEFRSWAKQQSESQVAQDKLIADQNAMLGKIETELEWWREFRESNRQEMKSAWQKLDHHDDLLHDLGGRVSRIEGQQGPGVTVSTT